MSGLVNGILSEWGAWSDCSKACGGGTRVRNKACGKAMNTGRQASETVVKCNAEIGHGFLRRFAIWQPMSLLSPRLATFRTVRQVGQLDNLIDCKFSNESTAVLMLASACDNLPSGFVKTVFAGQSK